MEIAQRYYDAGDMENAVLYGLEALTAINNLIMKKQMPARAIVNLGGEYKLGLFTFGLNIYNLLGTRYYRSGMNTNLIPQQGRWFMANVGIHI
jgi:iron complex outermembrane receptor protein